MQQLYNININYFNRYQPEKIHDNKLGIESKLSLKTCNESGIDCDKNSQK